MKMDRNIKRKMLIEIPIPVHSYDVDYMQIVNNTVYVSNGSKSAHGDRRIFSARGDGKSHNTPIFSGLSFEYKTFHRAL